MVKLTKEQLQEALKKPILTCSEEEIRFALHIMGFDLKEYHQDQGRVAFEIHFRRIYVIKMEVTGGIITFSNRWVVFNDKEEIHHLNFEEPENLILILNLFINLFGKALLEPIGYQPAYIKEWSLFETGEEAKEFWQTFQTVLREVCPPAEPIEVKPETAAAPQHKKPGKGTKNSKKKILS